MTDEQPRRPQKIRPAGRRARPEPLQRERRLRRGRRPAVRLVRPATPSEGDARCRPRFRRREDARPAPVDDRLDRDPGRARLPARSEQGGRARRRRPRTGPARSRQGRRRDRRRQREARGPLARVGGRRSAGARRGRRTATATRPAARRPSASTAEMDAVEEPSTAPADGEGRRGEQPVPRPRPGGLGPSVYSRP